MKRLIGFSIGGLQQKYGDIRALEIARELGADAVDVSLDLPICDYRKAGTVYAQGDAAVVAYYRGLKEKADELGLLISQTHGKLTGFHNIKEDDDALVENIRIDLLATATLGAPVCVVHTATTIHLGPDAPRELMHRLNYEQFTRILPYAKEYGVKIATETFGDAATSKFHCCDFFGNIDEFIEAYETVKATPYGEYLTVCLDTGHCHKATRFGNPKVGDFIRRIGGEISVLHLHDNDTLTDQHKPPLTGSIDWKDTLAALEEVGYDGVYNMEINLRCFGESLMVDTADFGLKIMRSLLA